MQTLSDLPNEVLLSIIDSFDPTCPTIVATLVNLCLTSRKLYRVVQPALYASVQLLSSEDGSLENALLFLRTLLANPNLGKEVKRLNLHTGYCLTSKHHLYETALLDSLSLYDSENVQDQSLKHKHEGLRFQDVAQKLLPMLPNIEHFTLVLQDKHPNDLLQYIAKELVTQNIPGLRKLEIFHVIKEYSTLAFDLTDYIDIMKLPSLKELKLELWGGSMYCEYLPCNIFSRDKIELYAGLINLTTLRKSLSTSPSLKSFSFRKPPRLSNSLPTIRFTPNESTIRPADLVETLLRTHKSTLEQFTAIFLGADHHDSNMHIFPSFHAFEKLTRMSISYAEIRQHWHHLPPTLEYLRLAAREKWLQDEDLQDFQRIDAFVPNIKEVIVNGILTHPTGFEIGRFIDDLGLMAHVCHCCFVHGRPKVLRLPSEEFAPQNAFRVYNFLGLKYTLQIRELKDARFGREFWEQVAAEERLLLGDDVSSVSVWDWILW